MHLRFFSFLLLAGSFFAGLLLLPRCSNNPSKTPVADSRFTELMAAAQQLKAAGLLQQFNAQQLDSTARVCLAADSLNSLQELLVRSGDMLELRLTGDSTMTPEQLYQPVFDNVAQRWPDLRFDSLRGNFLPYVPGDTDTGWALVQLRADNRSYERRHYWFSDDATDYLFYRTYNKLLADRGAKERLYMVQYLCKNCKNVMDNRELQPDMHRVGLLRLTETQAAQVQKVNELLMDDTNEFNLFSTAQTETALQQFAQSGLLTAADSAWWREAKNSVRQTSIYSTENLLDEFEKYFAILDFGTVNDLNPYAELMERLAVVSNGLLDETTIADEAASPQTHAVRFILNGKLYEKMYDQHDSLWSPQLLTDLNAALDEQKVGAAYYSVFTKEHTVQVVLLRDAVVEQARRSGFFPLFERGAPASLHQQYEAAGKTTR